jgi:hypothetical protein
VSQTFIDVLVEGVQRGAEFGWRLGLVGGEERAQDAVVDLGVEECETEPVGGEVVGWCAGGG